PYQTGARTTRKKMRTLITPVTAANSRGIRFSTRDLRPQSSVPSALKRKAGTQASQLATYPVRAGLLARPRRSRKRRRHEERVRGQWQQEMKQPILELRPVCRLSPHPSGDNKRIRCSAEAHQPPRSLRKRHHWPRNAL